MIERFERFSLAIFEISRHWHKIAGEEMAKYGLKGQHATYLLAIASSENGITAPQICETYGKDKADVSRMMSIMEQKGLDIKESVHQNMYRGVFKLTAKGEEAVAHVRQRVSLAVELAGKDLDIEKRTIFYEALESIMSNMREISKEGLPQ